MGLHVHDDLGGGGLIASNDIQAEGIMRARARVTPFGNLEVLEVDVDAAFWTPAHLIPRRHVVFSFGRGDASQVNVRGVIMEHPNPIHVGAGPFDPDQTALRRLVAYGALEVFKDTPAPPYYIDTATDIVTAVRDLVDAALADGSLEGFTTTGTFAPIGSTIFPVYTPYARLSDAVDSIVSNVEGLRITADFQNELDVLVPSSSQNIDYTTVKSDPLPVNGYAITTAVHMLVVAQPSGLEPERTWTRRIAATSRTLDYLPMPQGFRVEHADHARDRAERVYPVPDGLTPFIPTLDLAVPSLGESLTNITGGSNHRDDDETTYSNQTAVGSQGIISYATGLALYTKVHVGWKLTYYNEDRADPDAWGVLVQMGHAQTLNASSEGFSATAQWQIPTTDADGATLYALFPPDPRFLEINTPFSPAPPEAWSTTTSLRIGANILTAGADFQVFEFVPLIIDTAQLTEIINNTLVTAKITPERITVPDLAIQPTMDINLQNVPGAGGDVLLPASSYEYEVDEVGQRTRVSLDTSLDSIVTTALLKLFREQQEKTLYPVKLGRRS
jgi:hypothetical protein